MTIRRFLILAICLFAIVTVAISGPADIEPAKDAPHSFTPEGSLKKFNVPDGFRLEVVASEPLLADPSGIAFDARGRLLVCELHGYNLEGYLDVQELNKTGELNTKVERVRITGDLLKEAQKQQQGIIKLLSDTDGDGRMDKATVWADDLPPAYGIVPAREGVIVACGPDIVYLADRDGDGKSDFRETLFTGFTVELMERAINNPRWGVDNWIYFGSGGGGGLITGPHLKEPVRIGHSDFRIKADGTAIEWAIGSVGTYGVTVNEIGDRFLSSGGQPGIYALPLPNRYLERNPNVPTPRVNHSSVDYNTVFRTSKPHPWRTKRGSDPAWVKFYGARETNNSYFTGSCGNEIYTAGLFGEDYRGNFFCCEPSQNIIHRCIIERNGSGYQGHRAPGNEQSEFLASSEEWFRPVNLRVGPDGALYIVDMYREIIEDYSAIPRFLQQQYDLMNGTNQGRIYRLVPDSKPLRELRDLTRLSTDELVQLTGDSDAWWRLMAQHSLIERSDTSAVAGLSDRVRKGKTPAGRMHALYTLDGLGALTAADVSHSLADEDYSVRMHALRLSESFLRKGDADLAKQVAAMVDDSDERVRLQVALTLGESKDSRVVDALLKLADQHGAQRWMKQAILTSATRTAGPLMERLLASKDDTEGADALLPALAATIASQRDSEQILRIVKTIADLDQKTQLACVKGLIQGLSRGGDEVPVPADGWDAVSELLTRESPALRSHSIRLGALLNLNDTPAMKAAYKEAFELAADEEKTIDQRKEALKILALAPYETLTAATTDLLNARHPTEIQIAAVAALGGTKDARVSTILLSGWRTYTPKMRTAVMEVMFSQQNRLSALLDAVEDKSLKAGDIAALKRDQLIRHRDEAIANRAKQLLSDAAADAAIQELYEKYQVALDTERDVVHGKEVFGKICGNCHKIGNEGHEVGPDLGGILNRPDDAILVDMLDPSRHVEAEYRTYVVETNQGKIFTGVLTVDAGASITLRAEKGVDTAILRKDIEQVMASDQSLMPTNLHEQMPPKDAADVIAYIRTALGKKGAAGG